MALYRYPSAASDYALIRGGNYYPTRRNGGILGVVLHITAGLQDLGLVGDDLSAEGTARWGNNPDSNVSWHVGVDTDTILPCIPAGYTAWHAAGYNSRTFGIEISKKNVDWSTVSAAWKEKTLRNAARALAPIVVAHKLPLVRCTKAQVDAAQAANRPFGFVYHSTTSAGTRSDPGANFPFEQLMNYIRAELAGTTTPPTDPNHPDWSDNVTAAELALVVEASVRKVMKEKDTARYLFTGHAIMDDPKNPDPNAPRVAPSSVMETAAVSALEAAKNTKPAG